MKTIVAVVYSVSFLVLLVFIRQYSYDTRAIKAIIGEAEGENYNSKLAVACAIRNRGHLKGVYGLNSKRVRQRLYSSKTYKEAQKAWKQSISKDITAGATHWVTSSIYGTQKWMYDMNVTARIGSHTFMAIAKQKE